MAKKEKGILYEFKTFITKGNVMDLAVGVIIGGAFQKIVSSLVDDLIMPIVGLITGGIDFSNRFISLDGKTYETLEAAKSAGAATFSYGTFITTVINFIIMAFVIFMLVKGINKLSNLSFKKKEEEEKPPATTKICPFCQTEISIKATRCPHCTSVLETEE